MEILDMKCAEYGNKIIEGIGNASEKNKIESMITKALGVLQEDGLYAFALYSKAKSGEENTEKNTEKKTAKLLYDKTFELLKTDTIKILTGNCNDLLIGIRENLSSSLDKLFLAKELIERTLVYARYHAKALGNASGAGGA